jgi:hypothetical protein
MGKQTARTLGTFASLTALFIALYCLTAVTASAQDAADVYTANAVATEGATGDIGGRLVIRIVSYTTAPEKTSLVDAFKKDPAEGLTILRTMSKGYINVEGRSGRKVNAAFVRDRQDGREIILIGEHVASKLEQSRGVKAEDHPLVVMHLRFGTDGKPISGEVFPAVKLTITPDGFLDVKTDSSNRIMLINIARR